MNIKKKKKNMVSEMSLKSEVTTGLAPWLAGWLMCSTTHVFQRQNIFQPVLHITCLIKTLH